MKVIEENQTIKKYKCSTCGNESYNENDIIMCEKSHISKEECNHVFSYSSYFGADIYGTQNFNITKTCTICNFIEGQKKISPHVLTQFTLEAMYEEG